MQPSVLVHNETVKLTANAYDRASTGFGVGAVVPLFSGWRTATQGSVDLRAEAWIFAFSTASYLFAAVVLHLFARAALRRLKG